MTHTTEDLGRHVLGDGDMAALKALRDFEPREEATVADVIADACMVGYGGHYDEVLDTEEQVLFLLAERIGPLYGLSQRRAYDILARMRLAYCSWLVAYLPDALRAWKLSAYQRYVVDQRLDVCPSCGKNIKDYDELGCEAPDGQRWCVEHALEELARLRKAAKDV